MIGLQGGIWKPFTEYMYDAPLFTGELQDSDGRSLYLELYHNKLVHCYQADASEFVSLDEASLQQFEGGIRLTWESETLSLYGELSAQWQGNFKLGYEQLRRYCYLEDFTKKYKIKGRLKLFEGFVFECVKFINNGIYQVQIFKKYELLQYRNTMTVLRRVNHPHMLKLIEVYKDEENIYVLYQRLKGELLSSYYNKGFKEKQIASYFHQVLTALKYMHDKRIYHNNINGDSILVDGENTTVINFESASEIIQHNDLQSVAKLLNRFFKEQSQSLMDLIQKLNKLQGINQILYHQWFVKKQKQLPAGESLVTIMEKTENDLSQMESMIPKRTEEMYTVEEEQTLLQNFAGLQQFSYLPSKNRHI